VRVEWHEGDAADLAFLRADSIDLAFATGLLGEVDDVDRLLRQVQRVLRPGPPFVFSFDHPIALALGRDVVAPGTQPLALLALRRRSVRAAPRETSSPDGRRATGGCSPAPPARAARRCAPRARPYDGRARRLCVRRASCNHSASTR